MREILLGWVLVILLGGASSKSKGTTETVDLIELNHYAGSFDQVIFYRWSPDYRRYDVIAWMLTEGRRYPTRDYNRMDTVVRWFDRDAGAYREVRAKMFRETWSDIDPERASRSLLEEKDRMGLMRLPAKEMAGE
jgi:hypothetical protein